MSKHHRFYRPELDVLRFLAFLLVFFHHSALFQNGWLDDLRQAGAFGVCLFFLLSAFLITELLDREFEATGTIRLRSFYVRRILRIWPLYFAALLLDFLHLHWTQPGVFSGSRLAAFLLLAGNWFVATHGLIGSFSAPLWSISVEEQFYLLWPTVRRYLGRIGSVCFSCAAVLLAFFVLHRLCDRPDVNPVTGIWCNSFVQFQFFASGALLALVLRKRAPMLAPWLRVLLACTGLSTLFFAQSWFHAKAGAFPPSFRQMLPGYLLVNLACLALFFSFFAASSLSRAKPFIYLGRISYGLYVFHWGILSASEKLAARLFPSDGHNALWWSLLRVVLAFGATVLAASLSYHFFERPILRYKQRFEVIRTRPA